MPNATDSFLAYLYRQNSEITPSALQKARECLADYIAVTVAGASYAKSLWGSFLAQVRSGEVPLLGYGVKTDGRTACLVNGYNAHCLELDDGQRYAMIHLGASIISALLSASCENIVETEDFLKGVVMGYEAACRLALAVQPGHKKRGFHTAGTCGTVGAAVGVAFALKMGLAQMKTVLSAAVGSAAGMLELQEQGSQLKPFNLGRAAMDGLSAAYMGFTTAVGPDDVLGGDRGFFKLFTDEAKVDRLVQESESFEIERIYVKPYAACRHCHSAIEAALALRSCLPLDDIAGITVKTYSLAIKGHDHAAISGLASAKLSIPYSVAAAFVLGTGGVEAFTEDNCRRADILSLMKKVAVQEVERPRELPADARFATVEVKGRKGEEFSHRVDYAKGDAENPLTREEMQGKISSLLKVAANEDKLLAQCAALLDGNGNVRQLLCLL